MRTFKIFCFSLASLPLFAQAQNATPALVDEPLQSRPTEFRASFEKTKLPGNESMGLIGVSYLFQISPEIYAGPSFYGAATGKRGGFFTGGGDIAWRKPLSANLHLHSGVYVGGGGGGAAAVGGGLMVRPYVDLSWKFDQVSVGVSASQVRFPNGQIDSKQVGVVLTIDDHFLYGAARRIGESIGTGDRGGMGFDRISVVTGQYRPKSNIINTAGETYAGSIGYAGFRADQEISEHVYWGLESGAAIHGGADGYAEVLGTLGVETSFAAAPNKVGARIALGMGGGGKVPTGGGIIAKAALTLREQLTDTVYVGLEGGLMTAPKGDFKARFITANVGIDLDGNAPSYIYRSMQGAEWGAKFTRYSNAARYNNPDQSFDTLGFSINRSINKNLYFSGQALSAMDGNAGGFSMGLVGLGYNTDHLISKLSLGAEALVGAAGGGGVNTKGGAVAQATAYANLDLNCGARIKLGVGKIHSFKGLFRSPSLDVTVSIPFSVPGF